VNAAKVGLDKATPAGCVHIDPILTELSDSIDASAARRVDQMSADERETFINAAARENVHRVVKHVTEQSPAIARMVESGEVAIVGALYDVVSGKLDVFEQMEVIEAERVGTVLDS